MFTGIIEKTSKVKRNALSRDGMRLTIEKPAGWKVKKGDSINVNGVCSTAVFAGEELAFDYMPETLAKTAQSVLAQGNIVNLERSLTLQKPLDGHIVQGHIDLAGVISSIQQEGNSHVLTIELPKQGGGHMRYVVPKGSVAVDGVSLTVVKTGKAFFTVHLAPYTWRHTNFRFKKPKSLVNIECDIMAKYLEKLISNKYAART